MLSFSTRIVLFPTWYFSTTLFQAPWESLNYVLMTSTRWLNGVSVTPTWCLRGASMVLFMCLHGDLMGLCGDPMVLL